MSTTDTSSSLAGQEAASVSPPVALGRKRHFWASGRVILALMLREMSTRYGRSPGGYLWAFLEPIGIIVVMAMGFSLLVRTPPLGSSFILFFATGMLPFTLYQNVINAVGGSIAFSKSLLKYPIVSWIDAMIARFALNALTGMLVTYILIVGLLQITETKVIIDIAQILLALTLAAFLGLGLGAVNCALNGMIAPWPLIWSIITRPLFLASGIILMYEDLPETAQSIIWYVPQMHISGIMRSGFYPTYTPDYVSVIYVVAFCLVTLCLGLILLGRFHRDILNNGR
ncbi:ABC transporter permease [Sulfitobacter dubius]|uniref:ABC transporter permease n=1 Tax=Sulfitobacter dubius TaxID=218673 RepID=UPI002941D9DC|nr:ABC transporter permease [Sulfitobacter dubius]WOI31289.1 ABC transporter permease [Sulfitobacter dubius]